MTRKVRDNCCNGIRYGDFNTVVDDPVNQPDHYTVGGVEAIGIIKAKLTPEEYRGYLKGNMLKYLMRANYKGDHDNDCAKTNWYGEELMDALKVRAADSKKSA